MANSIIWITYSLFHLYLNSFSVQRIPLKRSRQLFLDRKTDRSVIFILYTETHLYRFQRNRSVITEMLSENIQTDPFIFGYPGRRYNYKIETVNLTLENLPAEFDHFKIVQLSDIHLGSFGESYPGMRKLVGEVNRLQPDIIVFTGDMVNNFAAEMSPWITLFQEMKASYGKYAITGNHDYGDYTRWPTETDKRNNLNQFFENMKSMGFHMLNNDRIPIVEGRDTLWLVGVENWGNPPFPRYGKLDVAIDSLPGQACIILLSHDPSHWRGEVLQVPRIALTLSGHTHAMQFGIKIGKNEWSPAQYIYPEYDGLYRHQNQYLYVSRGQGYLGFPGRIGLRPVITEFILHPNR